MPQSQTRAQAFKVSHATWYICNKHKFKYLSLAHNHHSLESYALDAKPGVTQTPLQVIIIMENSYTYIGVGYSPTPDGTVLVPLKI